MVEAVASDMHVFEVETFDGVNYRAQEVTALYWQAGADARGDDKRFVYFKDWRHRTVLAVKVEHVSLVRLVRRAAVSVGASPAE